MKENLGYLEMRNKKVEMIKQTAKRKMQLFGCSGRA